ncbi:phage tail protein [Burkholderia cenocepacia]|uniref:phage tail protein n=1 Tax=Burkholderia cenocepacia TaxID=95486 RepID=UPI000F5B1467|nr:phage tail protein [Burkholderia cenocepacia]RQU52924.1 phage tail protein [Burkholderia cenocepacia]RQV35044.1 phage tail protein [Burkholderia cenocepacia]
MAVDQKTMAATYPLPTYRFTVSVGKDQMAFANVSGLEQSVEKIQYQDGMGGFYQMPGQVQPVTITLKRGIIPKQSQLYDWMNSISLNTVEKKDLSISLTDESGKTLLVTWNVVNAFPTKLTGPSMDAKGNEVALEELSLLADRVTINFH